MHNLLAVLLVVGAVLVYVRGSYVPPKTNLDAARLDDLLHYVATHYQFGEADDGLTPDAMTTRAARGERLTLTCGWVSVWAEKLLTDAGYKARIVDWLTLRFDEFAGPDVGHTFLEVWHPTYGSWVVVDFTQQKLFPQTALSYQQRPMEGIALDTQGAIAPTMPWDEWRATYTDVLIIHADDGVRYFSEARRKDAILAYDARLAYVDNVEFLKKFYQ